MRKAALQTLFCSLVVVLAACGGSPAPRTTSAFSPAPPQPAPLSLYFDASDAYADYTLYALNASDGSVRWSQKNSAFPVLEHGVIYASEILRPNGIAAFNAADGQQRWSYQSSGGAYLIAVVDGVVYAYMTSLPSGLAYLYALHADDGKVLWHAAQPVLAGNAVVDGMVYATINPHPGISGVAAFTAKTGGLLWRYQPADGDPSFVQASNGQAYILVRSRDVGTQVYLSALNASDGSVRWRYPQTGYADLQLLRVGQGRVYLNSQADATLYALHASDGSLTWHVLKGGAAVSLQSLLTNDTLYVGLPKGTVYALNASDGSTKWQAQVGRAESSDLTATAPQLAAAGVVYVRRSPDGLFALNASNGAVQWVHADAQGAPWAVAAMNGVVYAYTNTIYAFNASDGSTRWSYQTGPEVDNPVVG